MRISSFGQQTSQLSTFKLSEQAKNGTARSEKNEEVSTPVAAPPGFSQEDLHFQIEKTINESSKFLHEGLVKIFDRGEALMAGRTSAEYDKHIKSLAEAVKGQDFKAAEKLIDKFYNGDSEKLITRVESLAKSAEEKFWQGMDDALDYLKDRNDEFDLEVDDEKFKNITMLDIAKIAISKAREEVDDFSEQDFAEIINPLRKKAVNHAKGKLSNAGQNKYSEDADSITAAAPEFARNRIFNTDDVNVKEDEEELADIYALEQDEKITEEHIAHLKFRNTRKSDTFSGYMRERSDRFCEIFDELAQKAIRVKEHEKKETPPPEEAGEGEMMTGLQRNELQSNINLPKLLPPDYNFEQFAQESTVIAKYNAQSLLTDDDFQFTKDLKEHSFFKLI